MKLLSAIFIFLLTYSVIVKARESKILSDEVEQHNWYKPPDKMLRNAVNIDKAHATGHHGKYYITIQASNQTRFELFCKRTNWREIDFYWHLYSTNINTARTIMPAIYAFTKGKEFRDYLKKKYDLKTKGPDKKLFEKLENFPYTLCMHRIDDKFEHASVMDLKLGKKLYADYDNPGWWKKARMTMISWTNVALMRFGFYMVGMEWKKFKDAKNAKGRVWPYGQYEMKKQTNLWWLRFMTRKRFLKYLNRFFETDRWNYVVEPVVRTAIDRIKTIVDFIKSHPTLRLTGSSIVIFFESFPTGQKSSHYSFDVNVKIIDFARASYARDELEENERKSLVLEPDHNTLKGLENIVNFMEKFADNLKEIKEKIKGNLKQ